MRVRLGWVEEGLADGRAWLTNPNALAAASCAPKVGMSERTVCKVATPPTAAQLTHGLVEAWTRRSHTKAALEKPTNGNRR